MRYLWLIFLFPLFLFSQEFFVGSYPSSIEGGEGAILNPSFMPELEGLQVFSSLNLFYERSDYLDYSSKEKRKFKGLVSASYNITEEIALGAGIFPLLSYSSNFKKDVPFRYFLRKFEYDAEELRASLGIRVMNNLNVGFALRQIGLDLSLSKSELSPEINGERYEVYGSYKGSKKDISFELSGFYKFNDYKFALIFRPETKIAYGFGDFSVNFTPSEYIPEEVYKTLKTFYPSGGVKTESYIPQQIIISGTKPVRDFEVSLCLIWTGWSSWNNLRFDYKNETVDPSTGQDVLKDQEVKLHFKDSFNLKGLLTYEFQNRLKGYFEILLKEKIIDNAKFAGLEMGNGLELTLGASYPVEYYKFKGKVFGYYTFSLYEENRGFDYKKNLLGAGLSFSF